MDQIDGASVVTVYYTAAGTERMTVTWLDMSATTPGSVKLEARSVAGHTALVLHDNADTAVVSGDAPASDLWLAALVAADL